MLNKKINIDLINQLQLEAKRQAQLEKSRILPRDLGKLIRLIMYYPWLSILLLSFITTILIGLL